jgi:hypothetical protein
MSLNTLHIIPRRFHHMFLTFSLYSPSDFSGMFYFAPPSYQLISIPFRPLNPQILPLPLFLPAELAPEAFENYTLQSTPKCVPISLLIKNLFPTHGK